MPRSRVFLVAAAVLTLLEGNTLARPSDTAVVPGLSVRNGDWVAIDALGIFLLPADNPSKYFAVVGRTELALGGVSAGFGLAMNLFPEQSPEGMTDFLFAGILSLEARAEVMFGPSSWRRTTYVGVQLSLAAFMKPAIAYVVAVDDPRDAHVQLTLFGGGW